MVAGIFSEASRDTEPCSPPPWALSGQVDLPRHSPESPNRSLRVHMTSQFLSRGKSKELIFLMGNNLNLTLMYLKLKIYLWRLMIKHITQESVSCHETHKDIIMKSEGLVSCRFVSGGHVSTGSRLPEHHTCEVDRRSPGSAWPVSTFPVQRQEEILRVRNKVSQYSQSLILCESAVICKSENHTANYLFYFS